MIESRRTVLLAACLFLLVAGLSRSGEDAVLCPIRFSRGGGGELWGYIDGLGNVIVPPSLRDARDFSGPGLALVVEDRGGRRYLNTAGEWAFPDSFDFAEPFSDNGLACVGNAGRYGFIDASGAAVVPLEYDLAVPFTAGGRATLIGRDGLIGVVDASGAVVVPPRYDWIGFFNPDGLAPASLDGRYGGLRSDGTVAVPFEYDEVGAFNEILGVAAVRVGEKYGLVDATGAVLIEPVHDFIDAGRGEGPIPFMRGDRYGYMDRSGREVISPRYAIARPFMHGLAAVSFAGGDVDGEAVGAVFGYIDAADEMIIQPRFDDAAFFSGDGAAPVRVGDMYGLVDRRGQTLLPVEFDFIMPPGRDPLPGLYALKDRRLGMIVREADGGGYSFYSEYVRFANGLTLTIRDGRGTYRDPSGRAVLEFEVPPSGPIVIKNRPEPAAVHDNG